MPHQSHTNCDCLYFAVYHFLPVSHHLNLEFHKDTEETNDPLLHGFGNLVSLRSLLYPDLEKQEAETGLSGIMGAVEVLTERKKVSQGVFVFMQKTK